MTYEKYDEFQPYGNVQWVPSFPCKVTVLHSDGTFSEFEMQSHFELERIKFPVAVKFHKPDLIIVRAQRIAKAIECDSQYGREVIRKTLKYLLDDGASYLPQEEKVDVNLRGEWLTAQMHQLGIDEWSGAGDNIRNWFFKPQDYPATPYLKNNEILTSKSVCGGNVVVLPSGHTISFTKAKQIWNEMRGLNTYDRYSERLSGRNINVGEYRGGRISHNNHRCDIKKDFVKVGCQVVSRKAIEAFAKLEGWK